LKKKKKDIPDLRECYPRTTRRKIIATSGFDRGYLDRGKRPKKGLLL